MLSCERHSTNQPVQKAAGESKEWHCFRKFEISVTQPRNQIMKPHFKIAITEGTTE
jgi:hypothetical protein